MAQTVSCRAVTARPAFAPGLVHVGFVVGQSGTGTVFSPSSLVSSVNTIPPWLCILVHNVGEEQNAQ
jgi:hypothetical protein